MNARSSRYERTLRSLYTNISKLQNTERVPSPRSVWRMASTSGAGTGKGAAEEPEPEPGESSYTATSSTTTAAAAAAAASYDPREYQVHPDDRGGGGG